MIKKRISIFVALALILALMLGIAGCSSGETAGNQNSNTVGDNSTDNSDVSGELAETALISISQEAADALKGMIANGDYSEDVFLRIDSVRGVG